jgi:hypothetical protein
MPSRIVAGIISPNKRIDRNGKYSAGKKSIKQVNAIAKFPDMECPNPE